MTVDSFPDSSEDVLNELDPLSRALLDLSIQRGMDDSEIAQVLGTDRDSVFEVRVGLLRNLAEKVAPEHVDDELPELQAAVAERLYPTEGTAVEADDLGDEVDEAELEETPVEVDADAEAMPEADAGAETEPDAHPRPQRITAAAEPRRKRRSPLVVLVPLLLLAALAALIIALASSGGGDNASNEGQTKSAAQPPPKPEPTPGKPGPARLGAVGSGRATGTATVTGHRVKLVFKDLPAARRGVYTVWLYNSVIDAKELKEVKDNKVTVTLPANAKKYEFLDVSIEPKDGNPNHSGESVLRVPLRKLAS